MRRKIEITTKGGGGKLRGSKGSKEIHSDLVVTVHEYRLLCISRVVPETHFQRH